MIILAYKYGQLGNRLAYLKEYIALAIEYDLKIIILSFDEYASMFIGSSHGFLSSYPEHRGFSFGKRFFSKCIHYLINNIFYGAKTIGFSPGSFVATPDENGCYDFAGKHLESVINNHVILFLSGWPCVPNEIIEKHSKKIREYFSLVNDYASIVKNFITFARSYGDYLVGIHIRQGDYRDWNGGKCYFETNIYVRLMRKILEKHQDKRVVFIVCSNEDQNWSLFEEFVFIAGHGDAVIDMYLLAECEEIYGPQSSFSAWASFYGNVPLYGVVDPD